MQQQQQQRHTANTSSSGRPLDQEEAPATAHSGSITQRNEASTSAAENQRAVGALQGVAGHPPASILQHGGSSHTM